MSLIQNYHIHFLHTKPAAYISLIQNLPHIRYSYNTFNMSFIENLPHSHFLHTEPNTYTSFMQNLSHACPSCKTWHIYFYTKPSTYRSLQHTLPSYTPITHLSHTQYVAHNCHSYQTYWKHFSHTKPTTYTFIIQNLPPCTFPSYIINAVSEPEIELTWNSLRK